MAMTRSLIIAPQWIGDAAMSEPLLRELHQRGEQITVAALSWVAPVYQHMPSVADVIELPFKHGSLQWAERRALARQWRGKFDRAYVMPNSLKSALIPWLADIPVRIGYHGETAPGIAGSLGFDRSIERDQAGLQRNLRDFRGRLRDLSKSLHGTRNTLPNAHHSLSGLVHRLAVRFCGLRNRTIGAVNAVHIGRQLTTTFALQRAGGRQIIDRATHLGSLATQRASQSGHLDELA
jgi:hypothetical protein